MKKVHILEEECCGCSVCAMKCPKNAIVMKKDKEGFLYPDINETLCIDCGVCLKVCAFSHKKINDKKPRVFAVKNKDNKIREKSSSGGMFTILSDWILKRKGYIVAATLEKDSMKVIHKVMDSEEERDEARGSKYVQSDMNSTFLKVKELLNQKRYVLFVGTACQVDGLKSYLGNIDIPTLILCDIICHGVPSPKIWEEYIQLLNQKNDEKIEKVEFKNKETGWHTPSAFAYTKNQRYSIKDYQGLFCKDIILRPSCYRCPYTNYDRVSDITIGDYWGIEKLNPSFDDNKGVSAVLINSLKGQSVFDDIINELIFFESNLQDAAQPNLKMPTPMPNLRNSFWKDYNKKGLIYVLNLYGNDTFINRVKRRMKGLSK